MERPRCGESLLVAKSLQELLQPQTIEPDATIVEVFGEKSKDADDTREKVNSFASMLSGTGGKNIFGQEVAPLTEEDLMMMVMGVTGGPMGGGKGLLKGIKKSPKIKTLLNKVFKGDRDVVLADLTDEMGNVFKQPFYKSSGKSGRSVLKRQAGELDERAGEWLPFIGRTTKQGRVMDSSGKIVGSTEKLAPKGWFIKGTKTGPSTKGKPFWEHLGKSGTDLEKRLGSMGDISKELKRLEGTGYFKKDVSGKDIESMNKWLKGQGVSIADVLSFQ